MWHMEKPRAETAARTDSRWWQYSRQTARQQQTDSQTGTQNNGTAQSSAPAQSTQQASGTVIGTCTTSYVDNIPRATNVALAAQRINGTVVQPGGSFSFSNTILPRTSANGYVTAPIYVSGKKGTGTGGGVCPGIVHTVCGDGICGTSGNGAPCTFPSGRLSSGGT